jgi:hypothetical protein
VGKPKKKKKTQKKKKKGHNKPSIPLTQPPKQNNLKITHKTNQSKHRLISSPFQ